MAARWIPAILIEALAVFAFVYVVRKVRLPLRMRRSGIPVRAVYVGRAEGDSSLYVFEYRVPDGPAVTARIDLGSGPEPPPVLVRGAEVGLLRLPRRPEIATLDTVRPNWREFAVGCFYAGVYTLAATAAAFGLLHRY